MKAILFLSMLTLPTTALAANECTNPNISFSICKAEAEAGHALAQVSLATQYMYGEKVERNEEQAFNWYLKAAEQGVASGSVAYMYATGTGTVQDDHEAAKWYEKAAQQGDAVSQVNLGRYYEQGVGVDADVNKAKALYKAACEGGNHSGCDEYERLQ